MKRRLLLKEIESAAKVERLRWVFHRHGANHDLYSLDGLIITIPRHKEFGERLSEQIFKECEPKLGSRWWR
jgi:hypothetical protein